MPRVLFWNVQQKQLNSLVLALVAAQSPDVVVLIESPPRSRLATFLAPGGWQRASRSERFTVFARQRIRLTRQPHPDPTDRVELWRVEPTGEDDWLFALAHGPDRRNATEDTRRFLFGRMRATIRYLEAPRAPPNRRSRRPEREPLRALRPRRRRASRGRGQAGSRGD